MKTKSKSFTVLMTFVLLLALIPGGVLPARAAGGRSFYFETDNKAPDSGSFNTKNSITVSAGETTVTIIVILDGQSAAIRSFGASDIDRLVLEHPETLELDLGQLGVYVSAASISGEGLRAVSHAHGDKPALSFKLTNGSVRFDQAALLFLSDTAGSAESTLTFAQVPYGKLMPEQQAAIWDRDVLGIYDLRMDIGQQYRVRSFEDGRAVVRFIFEGEAKNAALWHLATDGKMTRVPAKQEGSTLTATLDHFSNYVITREEASCPRDDTCPLSAFRDADPKAWYHDGVHYVLENGIMAGVGGGSFAPDKPVTRAMIAQVLWNMEGRPAYDETTVFQDVAGGAWYAGAVYWADAENVMDGTGEELFGPEEVLTREQLITILYRYANYKDVNVDAASDLSGYADADTVSAWAKSAMQWADASGLITGKSAASLNAGDAVTRAEIATTIMRYCALYAE